MHQEDRIKLWVALSAFILIGLSFALTGKSTLTKTFVVIAGSGWFIVMWYFRNKNNQNGTR
jgi:hypothetical protein